MIANYWKFPEFNLDFKKAYLPVRDTAGRVSERLVPVGMPTLRKDMGDCVFFLYGRAPKTGEIVGPLGTGCLVVREVDGNPHYYGVTNHHVAVRDGASIVRINSLDGTTRLIELDPSDWLFLPNEDDLCAVDLTDRLDLDTHLVRPIHERNFITREVISAYGIGIGEDCVMLGFLANAPAGEHNTPIARFGNLAFMADLVSTIRQPNGTRMPSHLMDMRSRTGFSGSPVFLYRTANADLTELSPRDQLLEIRPTKDRAMLMMSWPLNFFMGCLGIHCGQFRDTVKVYKSAEEAERLGDPIHEGDELYIQGSMTIIVPAWSITRLLNLKEFGMVREKRDAKRRASGDDAPQAESALPATDENPNHREDFTRLLGAAVRKPERED